MKFTKYYSNSVCEQILDVEVTKTSTSCVLTDWEEYSIMWFVYLTKRDIQIVRDQPDEQAILFVLNLMKKHKVKYTKIAHKTGRYWEDDLPR